MQASITKYLTQKQFKKSIGTKSSESIVTSKPTASVAPVVHRDPDSSSSGSSSPLPCTALSLSSTATSSTVSISSGSLLQATSTSLKTVPLPLPSAQPTTNASYADSSDSSVCDIKQTCINMQNGDEEEMSSSNFQMEENTSSVAYPGLSDINARGPVSLLTNSVASRHAVLPPYPSSINGDASAFPEASQILGSTYDLSKSTEQVRTNMDSAMPHSPSTTVANAVWSYESDPTQGSTSSGNGNKNVLFSTLNKANASMLVSKVVPGTAPQTAKVGLSLAIFHRYQNTNFHHFPDCLALTLLILLK